MLLDPSGNSDIDVSLRDTRVVKNKNWTLQILFNNVFFDNNCTFRKTL